MLTHLRANLWLLASTLLLCSILYPLALLGLGRAAFPHLPDRTSSRDRYIRYGFRRSAAESLKPALIAAQAGPRVERCLDARNGCCETASGRKPAPTAGADRPGTATATPPGDIVMALKRTLLIALAAALFAASVGCTRHHCCGSGPVSYAPPKDCCPP